MDRITHRIPKLRRIKKKKTLFILLIVFLFSCSVLKYFSQPSYFCEYVKIDYFHPDLDPYFPPIPKVDCNTWTPLVYFDDNGNLQQNFTEMNRLHHTNITCRYRCVVPTGPTTYTFKGNYSIHENVNSDVVHVTCKNSLGEKIYSDLLYHVNWNKNSFENFKEESSSHPSVILFGIDSLSAIVAERTLPKTLKYVRETLGGIDMKHYTKIGLNTRPNLLAALTGKAMFEALIPTFKYPELFQKVLDGHYVTCKGEDSLMPIGPLGFKYPIYHHDVRKYFEAFKDLDIFVKHKKKRKSSGHFFCKGNEMKHKILINFNKECSVKYKNKRKIVFSWIVDIIDGNSRNVRLADNDIFEYFKWMKDRGDLNNTFLFIFGDHGPKRDKFARTDVGRYTNRLPFFNIVLPTSMKINDLTLQNLLTNKHRLTTPFDFHETLKDIIYSRRTHLIKGSSLPRGISLFTEIPRIRTCAEASIPENYCPCYTLHKINIEHSFSKRIGIFLVDKLNGILKDANITKYCQLWHSPKVISVFKLIMQEKLAERYMVTIQVLPDNAEYIASVDVHRKGFSLVNTIDRANKYGERPSCLRQIGLFEAFKQYCFCF